MTKQFDFSEALRLMKQGKKVRRKWWHETIYVAKIKNKYIIFCQERPKIDFHETVHDEDLNERLNADDWEVVE